MGLSIWQSMDVVINPAVAGLMAATIHHFTLQYPNQVGLFRTVYAFVLINAVFLILFLGPKDAIPFQEIGRLLKDFLIFDSVYVGDPIETILTV